MVVVSVQMVFGVASTFVFWFVLTPAFNGLLEHDTSPSIMVSVGFFWFVLWSLLGVVFFCSPSRNCWVMWVGGQPLVSRCGFNLSIVMVGYLTAVHLCCCIAYPFFRPMAHSQFIEPKIIEHRHSLETSTRMATTNTILKA